MLKALERNVASVNERMVLLAPSAHSVSNFFKKVDVDSGKYHQLIQDVQRFRGSIYLQDGAIEPSPVKHVGAGHGLLGMRERVGLFSGRLEYGPTAGGGFAVHASIPALVT